MKNYSIIIIKATLIVIKGFMKLHYVKYIFFTLEYLKDFLIGMR